MVWDFKKELGRKVIHLFSIFILVVYNLLAQTFSHKIALLILAAFLILTIEFEYLRVERGMKIPILSLLWRYKRPKELKRLGGEVYFLLGAILCLALFDLRVAVAAILMTAFGDLTAGIVGTRFGKRRVSGLPSKTWEGAAAELLVNLGIGFLIIRSFVDNKLWWMYSLMPNGDIFWPVVVSMAVVATLVEVLVSKLDDNLLIPLFAGFTGQMALMLLGLA
ncbi:MAG: SEC59/DGK1/VTE5 family protein [Nanoarchaeota archaeon]|nr:SEC59/DGK1/VTE5 family protein [Nanoarchaeota archaeon]